MTSIRVLKLKVVIAYHTGTQIDTLSFIEDFEVVNAEAPLKSALEGVYLQARQSARSRINIATIQVNSFKTYVLSDITFNVLAEL